MRSHPSRVRELKQHGIVHHADGGASHPSRVRELKPYLSASHTSERPVAPLAGA